MTARSAKMFETSGCASEAVRPRDPVRIDIRYESEDR